MDSEQIGIISCEIVVSNSAVPYSSVVKNLVKSGSNALKTNFDNMLLIANTTVFEMRDLYFPIYIPPSFLALFVLKA